MITHEKQEKSLKWTFNTDFIRTERLISDFIFVFNFPKSFLMNIEYIYG